MAFAALLIHQAHGQTEFHFLVFVSLSLLLAYRDFRVIHVLWALCLLSLIVGSIVCAAHTTSRLEL
jgi:methyl-accepting chemotaxis protein